MSATHSPQPTPAVTPSQGAGATALSTDALPSGPSFEAAVEMFVTRTRHTKTGSPHTERAYRTDLRDLGRFLARRRLVLAHVTRGEASRYLAELAARVKPRTVGRRISCVRSFYRFLRSIEAVQDNPFDTLDLPSFDRKSETHKVLSVAQLQQMFDLLAADVVQAKERLATARDAKRTPALRHYFNVVRRRAVFSLAGLGGLRTAEILALEVTAFEQNADGFSVSFQGKGSKRRTVPLVGSLYPALVDWLTIRRDVPTTAPTLFVTIGGRPVLSTHVRRDARRLGARVGVPFPFGPHALRRTFATHGLAATGNLRGIGDLLGHASVSTTELYTSVDQSGLRDIVEATAARAAGPSLTP